MVENTMNQTSGALKTSEYENRFYVYALLDPRKPGFYSYHVSWGVVQFGFEPFYIGKGTGRRIKTHVAKAKNTIGTTPYNHKDSKISNILVTGKVPLEIKISDGSLEAIAFDREIELINVIGMSRDGGPLTNKMPGGQGVAKTADQKNNLRGRRHSEEAKAKMRESCKNRIPHRHTAESKAKIREYNKGKKIPESAVRKLIERNTGRVVSSESREKNRLSNLGPKWTDAEREKMSLARQGVPKSKEHVERQAAAQRGKPRPQTKCPHCPVVSSHGNIARWHGDNCKSKNQE